MTLKLKKLEEITDISRQLRSSGKTICFTNGCFDILHPGHIKYLDQAKALADILIIGLNSDSSVKKLKGPERPINNQNDRALLLSALYFVDYIVINQITLGKHYFYSISPNFLIILVQTKLVKMESGWQAVPTQQAGNGFLDRRGRTPRVPRRSSPCLLSATCLVRTGGRQSLHGSACFEITLR